MTKRTGYLWGTRGKTWGFRFLERGGLDNPLPLYEDMFAAIDDISAALGRHPVDAAAAEPSGVQCGLSPALNAA